MNVVVFDPDGGPVLAGVTSGFAQLGSYTILLWEAHVNKIVLQKKGNFINPDDDTYKLPRPNRVNIDRIVECLTTLAITPPIEEYRVRLSIFQDGKEIGFDEVSGKTTDPSVTLDQFVQLGTAP